MDATHTPEEWRPVVGYEGHYEVSGLGRVRSLDRILVGKNGLVRRHRGVVLAICWRKNGYPYVCLHLNGSGVARLVHHLVLEAFVGPRQKGMEGCHNDGDRANARADNLRWDTRSANHRDKRLHGTDPRVNRQRCPRQHLLLPPNLVTKVWLRRGHRSCRSCAAARAWVQRHPGDDFLSRADNYYMRYRPIEETLLWGQKTATPA